jgi:hypothetical protein
VRKCVRFSEVRGRVITLRHESVVEEKDSSDH